MNFISLSNFILINLALILSSLSLYLHLSKSTQKVHKVLIATFTLFISKILLIIFFLGILEILSYTNASLFAYAISIITILFTYKRALKRKIKFDKKLPVSIILLFFLPLAALLLLRAFNAFLQIPLEYDSLAYHLPFVAEWLNTGSLHEIYYSAFASPIGYYPANYELLDLWITLPFKNDFFINLLNFPLFVILTITIYAILINFKVPKDISIATSAIPLYMPIFLRQAGLPLVDVFFTLTFALSIYFLQLLYIRKRERTLHALLFGLSLGLFMGTKYLGLVYATIPLFLFTILALKNKPRIAPFVAGTVGTFLTGSFFYIRNWIDSGNPIFPVELKILGTKIFDGYLGINEKITSTSLLENVVDDATFTEFWENFFFMTGWESRLIAIATVALLILLFIKKTRNDKIIAATLFITAIAYFYLYFRSPYSYRDLTPNIRYAMMFLTIATISTGFFVSRLKFLKYYYFMALGIIFLHSLIYLSLYPPDHLLHNDKMIIDIELLEEYKYEFFIYLTSFLTFSTVFSLLRKKYTGVVVALLLFSFCTSVYFLNFAYKERPRLADYFYQNWYEQDRVLLYLMDSFTWLEENTEATKIAYTGFNFHYPLFAKNLSNEVDYININDCRNCRYLDFKDSPESIRRDPDFNSWLFNLHSAEKQYIFIAPDRIEGVEIYEETWVKNNPKYFKQVYANEVVQIYSIKTI